ncbi:MAG: lysophospholipid acyltransferase family protein [Candidatus Gastranaerophilales bacterium]|nr:lysophospholipid acyltransferase family protein [Candidatus Gastranaerophilales bacterium]
MAKRNYAKRETHEYTRFTSFCQFLIIYLFIFPYFYVFHRLRISGREHIPKGESFIVAATHSSYYDPPLVSVAVVKPIAYMAKKELFEVPILREIVIFLGAFAVNRESLEIATIRTAKAVIQTKHWIMAMFPQGNRDIPGKITKINGGFAYLSKTTKAKILPVSIVGSEEYNFIPFLKKITIRIGKPLPACTDMNQTMWDWCQAIENLGSYEFTQEAKDKLAVIQQEQEKKGKKVESTNTEG